MKLIMKILTEAGIGYREPALSQEDITILNTRLTATNSLVREFIIDHVDSLDEVLEMDPLVDYLEYKLDLCINDTENWRRLNFMQKEKTFSNCIDESDVNYFRKKGWIIYNDN